MKRLRFLGIIFLITTVALFISCPLENLLGDGGDTFVPVTGIIGVPTTGTVGTPFNLNRTVKPGNATNKTIVWEVTNAGNTGIATGTVNGKTVTAKAEGTLEITATIENGIGQGASYTQNFTIKFTDAFMPVSDITGVPTTGKVGEPLTLGGTVVPDKATNRNIVWLVNSTDTTTTVTMSGSTVTAMAPGTLTVTATIKNGNIENGKITDYTQDFTISFSNPSFKPVTGITGVPTTGTVGTALTLAGTVAPSDASYKDIIWSLKSAGTTGITAIENVNKVTAPKPGTLTVTATIENGTTQGTSYTQDFDIEFPFVPVSNITVVTKTGTVGTALPLTGTVEPSTATNKIIAWSVKDTSSTATGTVSGNTVTAATAGNLVVTATIENGKIKDGKITDYTQDFTITFSNPFVQFVPVAKIINIPTAWAVGPELVLNGEVFPKNAREQDIKYSVKDAGTTGITTGSIGGDKKVIAKAPGTLVVRATVENGKFVNGAIKDYTQDFDIPFIVPVTNIIGVSATGTVDSPLPLTGTVTPSTATQIIEWSIKNDGGTGATITGDTVKATTAGTLTVTATIKEGKIEWKNVNTADVNGEITDYTQDFEIVFEEGPMTPRR